MNQLIKDQFFSTTELKTNTKNVLDKTKNFGEIFIMNNNKPNVVIMSIEKYNTINKYYIPEVEADKWEIDAIKKYEKDQKEDKIDFIEGDEVFNFLNTLK